ADRLEDRSPPVVRPASETRSSDRDCLLSPAAGNPAHIAECRCCRFRHFGESETRPALHRPDSCEAWPMPSLADTADYPVLPWSRNSPSYPCLTAVAGTRGGKATALRPQTQPQHLRLDSRFSDRPAAPLRNLPCRLARF